MAQEDGIDRLSIRQRPAGVPAMHQAWCKLLFMHWQLAPELLRPHIPRKLTIDTFDGRAWVGITPFVLRNLRPSFLPPIPWLSDFRELNVRTYVVHEGVPGVWFFSLDADSVLAVLGASAAYHLPYRLARMEFEADGDRIRCRSRRVRRSSGKADLEAAWRMGEMVGEAPAGSLEFFLVERYCLFAARGRGLYRARIHHPPWRLQRAELLELESSMVEGQGLPVPVGDPLVHYSEVQESAVWPLGKVA